LADTTFVATITGDVSESASGPARITHTAGTNDRRHQGPSKTRRAARSLVRRGPVTVVIALACPETRTAPAGSADDETDRERRRAMFIVATHDISDPAKFREVAETAAAEGMDLPDGVTLHGSFPSTDATRCVCLWQADSVTTVRDIVEGVLGAAAVNDYYEVGSEIAIGLPAN
jgi:hypothetical protein